MQISLPNNETFIHLIFVKLTHFLVISFANIVHIFEIKANLPKLSKVKKGCF